MLAATKLVKRFAAVNRSFTEPLPALPVRMSQVVDVSSGTATADFRKNLGSQAAEPQSIVELRTYQIFPDKMKEYLEATRDYAQVRKDLNPGWLGFWTTETGGVVNEVKHMYAFPGGMEERDSVRQGMAASPPWAKDYLSIARPMFQTQESVIFVPAPDCMEATGGPGVGFQATDPFPGPQSAAGPVYEFRRYHLVAGYDAVPALRKALCEGLPSRASAPNAGRCMFMGYTDVGRLNVFIELWRHAGTGACIAARQGARGAQAWRETIADISPLVISFETQMLRPTSFSPWQ